METAALLLTAALMALGVGAVLIRWREHRQSRAMIRALYREVIGLRIQAAVLAAEIARRHAAGGPFDAAFFAPRRLSEPQLFPTIGWRIALLDGEALGRLGYFHAQLAEARLRRREALAAGALEGSPYRLLSNLLRAFNDVEPWLRRVGPPDDLLDAVPVDMTAAHELLSALEDRSDEPLALAYCWADVAIDRIKDTER